MTGVAPAEGRAPSAMFAAHASLIAEAYLAVCEHGPAAGIEVSGWWPDRQAWLTWRPTGGQDVTLSPDAIVTANLTTGETAGPAAAFVEIDLATMTQTRLRDKVRRYLAYAEDQVWAGRWPHCPPLLLLMTTEARAVTFLAAAAAELERHRRQQGAVFRYRGTGAARQDLSTSTRRTVASFQSLIRPR
ncbi:hypothetical protein FB565_002943 [Actinoplanes lutulentus]|nr:hypothetical protein [Actinoplanes lutulentus]